MKKRIIRELFDMVGLLGPAGTDLRADPWLFCMLITKPYLAWSFGPELCGLYADYFNTRTGQ
jgi:hypothetical protein